MRICLAQINPIIGDLAANTDQVIGCIEWAREHKADLVLFPELTLTGYPPEDFLLLPHFMDSVEEHLQQIIPYTENITAVIGLPRRNLEVKRLFNSAAIITNAKLLGYEDKCLLPTYDVFDERRYFEPSSKVNIWEIAGERVAITICEDIWQHSQLLHDTYYKRDPITELKELHPSLLLNLSASPYHFGKLSNRLKVCEQAAKSLHCPVIYCNQVGGNDSLIFDGYSLVLNAKGELTSLGKGFAEDLFLIDTDQLSPTTLQVDETEDLYNALVLGLRDYFEKSGFTSACLGLSGGIDSALVACIAADALGPENVLAVVMPSRYSSSGSIADATQLIHTLGLRYRHIPIEDPFKTYLDLLTPYFEELPPDATEENLQARIRGMILMALSNKHGYIVLSTGNKSELAMGYSTLYGDSCGGLAVISDVTKTQVYNLAKWINRNKEIIPWNTINKPPSAELRPNQKDSDSLPDYAIIDNVLNDYIEDHESPEKIAEKHNYPLPLVQDLIKKIHRNEYKRRQMPPGLRVTEKAFSAGRRFPIVQRWV